MFLLIHDTMYLLTITLCEYDNGKKKTINSGY